MKSWGTHTFVDQSGNPLVARLQRVLREMLPRVRNRFRTLGDELFVAEILEEAGTRIADHERQSGPVDNLKAYAWTTVLNVARSRMRHSSMRLVRETLPSEDSEAVLGRLRSNLGTLEEIETRILVQQVLTHLTADERLVCTWKQLGFSSREIAREQGTTVACVDTLFYRIKRKIRNALQEPPSGAQMRAVPPPRAQTA
jgi:RNA polymerase sigma factor (sigma-70 family)